jgi:predicted Rossmann fold nucleotide-binding protein DprA/Smf involved in DNA uptake
MFRCHVCGSLSPNLSQMDLDKVEITVKAMSDNIIIIESQSPDFPEALRNRALMAPVPRIWAIGNLGILQTRPLGFFCSTRCPGNIILRTYDLAQTLRAARISVIGGFHAPMEKECLDLLLRGDQPLVICPARSIERMRLPVAWRKPLDQARLLILSPFEIHHRRPTAELAEQRNRFVATLADTIFVAHAPPGSKTARLCAAIAAQDKRIYTLDLAENAHLMQRGVAGDSARALVERIASSRR